jgi:hypothetical protein
LLNTRTPTGPLYRIAWGTEPWEYPDWKRAGTDASSLAHTFGNRFDDPNAEYRVLYASSQLVSCYVEVLARFRPDYALLAELRAMDGEATKRIVTQRASSIVYDLGAFAGIYYDSRHGLGLENWALFEFKAIINPLIPVQRVSKNDPSLKQALEILHLAVAE